MKILCILFSLLCSFLATGVAAQQLDSKQPIEIASDTLEVMQNEHKAVFSGNVIAKQGNISMQASRMLVFYDDNAGGGASTAAAGVKGISRIEADGGAFFSSPRETVRGDKAVYEVNQQQIRMDGNVILTRDKNVLKGTQLTYNLKTGKSVLSAGGGTGVAAGSGGGRVKGLFVPNQQGQ